MDVIDDPEDERRATRWFQSRDYLPREEMLREYTDLAVNTDCPPRWTTTRIAQLMLGRRVAEITK